MRKYGGSRACGMCGNGGAAGLLQGCALWEVPFARADDRIGPPRGMVVGCRFRAVSRSRPQCRAGVFARRLGFAAAQGFRDDASIVPYGFGQGPAQIPIAAQQAAPESLISHS